MLRAVSFPKALLLAVLTLACSPEPAVPEPAAPVPGPNPVPPAEPSQTPPSDPAPAGAGESCGGEICKPPARCIDVVGMRPESAHKECWITCGDDKCPEGMSCTMIHDGPGKVCVKKE